MMRPFIRLWVLMALGLLVGGPGSTWGEDSCPPGGIPYLDDQLYQIGKAMGAGQISMNAGMQLANQLVAQKEVCAREPSGLSPDAREDCAQRRREFTRCRHEFNKKVVSGQIPPYTCIPPEC